MTTSLLIYCEALNGDYEPTMFKEYLDSLFNDVLSSGHSVIHGCTLGPLDFPVDNMFWPILGTSTGIFFMDFYNMRTGRLRKGGDINLLYV